ncbi:hypothetical protein KUV80_04300 [Fictibacillus nanhaiensis]|nr:hypothetical protein [Fictibacillus nanhaiensis]MBY6035857.1 hypothetical protein [Fictibacillus nanhaiensis]
MNCKFLIWKLGVRQGTSFFKRGFWIPFSFVWEMNFVEKPINIFEGP